MTAPPTPETLKSQGLAARYRHRRVRTIARDDIRSGGFVASAELLSMSLAELSRQSEKGGTTTCELFDMTGEEPRRVATGEARCRPDENFSKQLGRMISLGRALTKIEQEAHG